MADEGSLSPDAMADGESPDLRREVDSETRMTGAQPQSSTAL